MKKLLILVEIFLLLNCSCKNTQHDVVVTGVVYKKFIYKTKDADSYSDIHSAVMIKTFDGAAFSITDDVDIFNTYLEHDTIEYHYLSY